MPDDANRKMAAFARSGVAGVSGAVIHDFQPLGRQRGAQPLVEQGDPVGHAGSTLRKGYTSTAANTPAAT